MRRILTVIVVVGCFGWLSSLHADASKTLTPVAVRLQTDDDVARLKVDAFWNSKLSICKQDHFAKAGFVFQYKDLKIQLETLGITTADKLNGLEYKGVSSITATAYRSFQFGSWQPWQEGMSHNDVPISATILKQKGEWKIDPGILAQAFEPLDCSTIPPG